MSRRILRSGPGRVRVWQSAYCGPNVDLQDATDAGEVIRTRNSGSQDESPTAMRRRMVGHFVTRWSSGCAAVPQAPAAQSWSGGWCGWPSRRGWPSTCSARPAVEPRGPRTRPVPDAYGHLRNGLSLQGQRTPAASEDFEGLAQLIWRFPAARV